jgi:hypothetical protein
MTAAQSLTSCTRGIYRALRAARINSASELLVSTLPHILPARVRGRAAFGEGEHLICTEIPLYPLSWLSQPWAQMTQQ